GSPKCHPAEYTGSLPAPGGQSYCNAMIASDAFTLLSPNWPNRNRTNKQDSGSLEQPYPPPTGSWVTTALPPTRAWNDSAMTGHYNSGTVTINAAILTGNLQTN